MPNVAKARKLADAILRYKQIKAKNQCFFYKPFAKQKEFHDNGLKYAYRCLGAGNQLGKTYAAGEEVAFHATGHYPPWWHGRRLSKPNIGWVCGESGKLIRDTSQKILIGRIQDEGSIGTGALPHDCIQHLQKASGNVPGLLDHIKVKHRTGGTSLIFFMSYEMGREKFQGETIDWIWFDEEPPQDIYSEGCTRTNKGQSGRFAWLTFTPLKGMTQIVQGYYQEPTVRQILTIMTIYDTEDLYADEEREAIIAEYPPHERDARTRGIPALGQGRIYPVSEERITCEPRKIPRWWPRVRGMDFGWNHPQAICDMAYDPDDDIVYVRAESKEKEMTPSQFSLIINKSNSWIPVAWPKDGINAEKGTGQSLISLYKDVEFLPEWSRFEDGGVSVEAGISDTLDRMITDRWKVFNTCEKWLEEFRLYHRKEHPVTRALTIVKLNDDLLDASRYGLMDLRYAISQQQHEFDPQIEGRRVSNSRFW